MMLTNKKTNRASWLKLLALVPIVGIALALNAETVTDYVYNEPKTPQKKVVKKGRKDGQVKLNAKTIEVKKEKPAVTGEARLHIQGVAEAVEKQEVKETPKLFFGEANGPEPLLILNGKVATKEQVMALDQDEIDHINVLEDEERAKRYGQYFNADVSNGIVFVNTKDYMKNGKKEIMSVTVKAKKPREKSEEKAFDVVEQMPQFPGGDIELMKFLSENIKYPEAASKAGTQGRVVAQFIVEADGSITNVKVLKKVSDEIDAEAVRVINAMPKWKPGMQKGQPVRVKYTIPVTFRLS